MENRRNAVPFLQNVQIGQNTLSSNLCRMGLYIGRFLNVIYVCVFYSREGQSPSPSPIKERQQDIARYLGSAFTKIKKKVMAV